MNLKKDILNENPTSNLGHVGPTSQDKQFLCQKNWQLFALIFFAYENAR